MALTSIPGSDIQETEATASKTNGRRHGSHTKSRHDHNTSASSTKDDQPPQPSIISNDSSLLDSVHNSTEGNEADTEATSFSIQRKHKRSTTTGRIAPLTVRPTTTPTATAARQAIPRPGTSEGLTSSPHTFSPADYPPSPFLLRTSTSNELRSPIVKRPPASRSSQGVATSKGPPPAISTQRAFSFELQQNKASEQFAESSNITPEAELGLDNYRSSGFTTNPTSDYFELTRGRSTVARAITSPRSHLIHDTTQSLLESRMDRRKRLSVDGRKIATHRPSTQLNDTNLALQDAVSNGSSHEDLFLNMAQAVVGDQGGQAQKNSPSSNAKFDEHLARTHERRSSVMHSGAINDFRTPLSQRVGSRDRTYASTAHPLEGRYTSPAPRRGETCVESPSDRRFENHSTYHSRFRSAQLPTPTNTFQALPLDARYQSSDQEGAVEASKTTDGTESSLSATAPSTVWDELDDLKARIRKLESTGKLPPSSSGSMERPRTAATSATTMSSSPKRTGMKSASPTTSAFEENVPHSLLSSALEKARGAISAEAYRALEATATDAMTLSKLSPANHHPSTVERQLKRKADNMCRSLTELCIALAANSSAQQERPPARARSSSRDVLALRILPSPQQQPTPEGIDTRRFERAQSLEPEQTSGQRALSRLEARRTSIRNDAFNTGSAQLSPRTEIHVELKTPTQSTVPRTNTVLQRRRIAESLEVDDQENTIRPLSRANTELTRANTTSVVDRERKRMSREYTSKHPLPSPFTRNFPGISNVPGSRRSYLANGITAAGEMASGTNNSATTAPNAYTSREKDLPLTPATPDYGQRRGYLSRNTSTPSAMDGIINRTATEPRQRILSSGQHNSTRSYLSTRAGDRRSFVEANPGDVQLPGGQF